MGSRGQEDQVQTTSPFSLLKMRVTFSLIVSSLLVALSSSPVFARPWEPYFETDDFGEHVVFSIGTTSIRTTEDQTSSPLAIICPGKSWFDVYFDVYPFLLIGLPNRPSLRDYAAERDFRLIINMILNGDLSDLPDDIPTAAKEREMMEDFLDDVRIINLHVRIDRKHETLTGILLDDDPYFFSGFYPIFILGTGDNLYDLDDPITSRTKEVTVSNEGTPVTFDVSGWEGALREHCR